MEGFVKQIRRGGWEAERGEDEEIVREREVQRRKRDSSETERTRAQGAESKKECRAKQSEECRRQRKEHPL